MSAGQSEPQKSISQSTRDLATMIDGLGDEVVRSFALVDDVERVRRLKGFGTKILVSGAPLIHWTERNRDAQVGELIRLRLHHVVNEAVECVRYPIPEYAGGVIHRNAGDPSEGARRTMQMVAMAMAFAESLRGWAGEIEAVPPSGWTPTENKQLAPTIWFHGERQYSTDRMTPMKGACVALSVL